MDKSDQNLQLCTFCDSEADKLHSASDNSAITVAILEKELRTRTDEYYALNKLMDFSLAKKNEVIDKLKVEIDYWKNQERIRTNQLRATEAKVEVLWKQIEDLKAVIAE